jgi:hypothetical protein
MKHKAPNKPEDCHTLQEKMAYSLMVGQAYEKLVNRYDAKPSDLSDFFDRFPLDERYPWSHPEWWMDQSRVRIAKRKLIGKRFERI